MHSSTRSRGIQIGNLPPLLRSKSGLRSRYRAVLATVLLAAAFFAPRDVAAAPQTATINGAQISYEVCGDEKAQGVVLLHDGLLNSAVWDGVWPGLCEKYRVARYDRRGYGKSPPAKEPHFPTEDLLGVMKLAGLSHAHLVGAGAGAGLAIDFLFDEPEAIDKLVLVAPSVSGFTANDVFVARLRAFDEVIAKGDMDAVVAAFTSDPYFFPGGNEAARKKFEAIVRASLGDLGAHPFQRRPADVAQRLGEVYAPALILVGANDHGYTKAMAGAIGERMRAAQARMILNAGAFPYLEVPEVFVGAVAAFLQ